MPPPAVSVSPTNPHSTHHLSLTAEDGTIIGLILCDSKGKRLPTNIARNNLQTVPVKTASGDSQYSDLELPFTVSAQSNYEGGLGQDRFEDNKTKYARGRHMQVKDGKAMPGPFARYTHSTLIPQINVQPREGSDCELERYTFIDGADPERRAAKFTTIEAVSTAFIWIMAKQRGQHLTGPLLWEIRADGADPTGALIDSGSWPSLGATEVESLMEYKIHRNVSSSVLLAATTTFWFVLIADAATTATRFAEVEFWSDATDLSQNDIVSAFSNDGGSTWTPNNGLTPIFRITENLDLTNEFTGEFYEYQGQQYFMTQPYDFGAPRIFENGWRGAADANGGNLSTLIDATQTAWANDAAAETVALIISGPGSQEPIPWRFVVSSVAGTLSVDIPWVITHTTATNYVLLGADFWTEITGHGMTEYCNDTPLEVGSNQVDKLDMMLYFVQGRAKPIRVHRQSNIAGVWTYEWRDWNPGERAEFIIIIEDDEDGWKIIKAEQGSITGVGALTQSRAPDFNFADFAGGPQGFTNDELIGHNKIENINNLIEYVDPDTDERQAWIIAEDRLVARDNVTSEPPEALLRSLKLDELSRFSSKITGLAAVVQDTFLYFSMQGGLWQQFTNGVLVDVSPNKNLNPLGASASEAVVTYEVADVTSWPGTQWLAADGGYDGPGRSFVFEHGGGDVWDPIYTSPEGTVSASPGARAHRIKSIYAQQIPRANNQKVNRLWVLEGKDLVWMDLPTGGLDPVTDTNYSFWPEGYIELSKIYAELDDRDKLYSSLKLITQGIDDLALPGKPRGTNWIEVDFAIDRDDDVWTYTGEVNDFHEEPSQEQFLTDYFTDDTIETLRGKYLKLRLRMNSSGNSPASASGRGLGKGPRIRASLVESIIGLPIKFSFAITTLFEDAQIDEQGDPDPIVTAAAKETLLQDFADDLEAFTLHSISPTLDNVKVVIGAPEIRPAAVAADAASSESQIVLERNIGTMSFLQIVRA